MNSKGWLARAMTVGMAVVVVACAKKEEETQANIEIQAEAPPPPPITTEIVPATGSTVMGTITATHAPENTTVQISMTGLTEDKDYDATIRYGDCTIAPQYLKDDPSGDMAPTTGTPEEHKLGDDFLTLMLNKEATTATAEATLDNDDLRADEPAYIVVTQADMLVACADLKGHGGMSTAPSIGPSTTPMPADTMK